MLTGQAVRVWSYRGSHRRPSRPGLQWSVQTGQHTPYCHSAETLPPTDLPGTESGYNQIIFFSLAEVLLFYAEQNK